ncbi:MAG TPA: nitroreductase family protein [Chthoniobacterales bacterium]|nr:nitroreductase family protein [Chthoniobacterales bacterium]
MEKNEAQTYLEKLTWRYATKKFDPSKKIPAQTWSALEKSLQLSPSSFGLQPYAFIVVTDPAVRAKLRVVAHDQPQVTESSHLVVFAARTNLDKVYVAKYIDHIAKVRGVSRENLAAFQSRIAAANTGDSSTRRNRALIEALD